jgi:hypothetical protein
MKKISDHRFEVTEPTTIRIGRPASPPKAEALAAIRKALMDTGATTVYWFWVSISGDAPHLGLAVAPDDDAVVSRVGRAVEPLWRMHSPDNPSFDILRLGDPKIDPLVAELGELLCGSASASGR